jgi:hypothetical protein
MIALIACGVFVVCIVAVLVLMLRSPRGREIPGVGFVRDEDVVEIPGPAGCDDALVREQLRGMGRVLE